MSRLSLRHARRPLRAAGRLVIAGLAFGAAEAVAGDIKEPPERPFETLSDTWQARSTYIFTLSDRVPTDRIPAHAAALTRAVGGELLHTYTEVLGGFAARMPSTAMLALMERAGSDIVAVERDSVDYILNHCHKNPNHCGGDDGGTDPEPEPEPSALACSGSYTEQNPSGYTDQVPWGVNRIDAETAAVHGDGKCGQGVHVYVIDTGIDLDHPDLAPVGTSVDCTKRGGCKIGGDDDHGHGTHVAGTIGGRINNIGVVGIAPAVEFHAVKVLSSNGMGFRSNIIAGIDWVAKQVTTAPVVANMSIGGSGSKSGTCSAAGYSGSDSYHAAICNATNKGVVFAVAAGNSGADAAGAVPAAYDDTVITVSATNNSDDWTSWSNWGNDSPSPNWTDVSAQVTSAPVGIAAPGSSILSTKMGGGTTTMSGTSMASPHVAGAVALRLQEATLPSTDPYYVFERVRAAVLNQAEATDNWGQGGNIHVEKFLDAESLVNTAIW